MQAYFFNFWNKYNLRGYKGFLILILVVFSYFAEAQAPPPQRSYIRFKRKVEINLPNYDDKLLHYGFFLALNYNRLNINQSQYFIDSDSIKTLASSPSVGFSLGFLLNIRLFDQLAFRILPSVGFYDRDVIFTYPKVRGDLTDNSDTTDLKKVETTFIETSFLFKYKSIRRTNHRFYLVGGVKPAIRAGGKKSDSSSKNLDFARLDFSVEYGAGVDLYFPFFKFSPELRFSHGLFNMNTSANNEFNNSILTMYTHTVTLYFFFE